MADMGSFDGLHELVYIVAYVQHTQKLQWRRQSILQTRSQLDIEDHLEDSLTRFNSTSHQTC